MHKKKIDYNGTTVSTNRFGYPDLSMHGNFFVATDLLNGIYGATGIRQVLVNGNLPDLRPGSVSFEEIISHLKEFAEVHHNIDIKFAPIIQSSFEKNLHGSRESLIEVVEDAIKHSNDPVVIDLHYPEREMRLEKSTSIGIHEELRDYFGHDIILTAHLHCMKDTLLGDPDKYTRNRDRKRYGWKVDGLRRAFETGTIDQFIAVSPAVRDSFSNIFEEHVRDAISVVGNGINPDIYALSDESHKEAFRKQFKVGKMNPDSFLVGYSGRIDSVKGSENLMHTINWFNDHPEYDVSFLLAATQGCDLAKFDSFLAENCQRLLKENRIGIILDAAKFYGNVKTDNQFVRDYFDLHIRNTFRNLPTLKRIHQGVSPVPIQRIVDVYMQPSISEAFGLAACEALMCGTPVVASRTGGLIELVSQPAGTVVDISSEPKCNGELFANAILNEISRSYNFGDLDTFKFRSELRDRLVKLYSKDKMVEETLKVYSEAKTRYQ